MLVDEDSDALDGRGDTGGAYRCAVGMREVVAKLDPLRPATRHFNVVGVVLRTVLTVMSAVVVAPRGRV